MKTIQNLILCAVKKSNIYNQIEEALREDYNVVPCYNAMDALKRSMNAEHAMFIISEDINKEIPTSLIGMWHGIESTKNTPVIMVRPDKDRLLFNSTIFITDNTYGIDRLKQEVDQIILGTSQIKYDGADVKTFMKSLILALEAKDEYSRNHSARVSCFATALAKFMNLPSQETDEISVAGFFHDIGKIGIPDVVLLKPGKLNDDEYHTIQRHPVLSERICHPVKYFVPILPIIKGHHERIDGKGYPDGLSGQNIPLGARIVAVADAFDALTSNRPYREAFSLERVKNIMMDGVEKQWDKEIVETFWNNISMEKIIEILSNPTEYAGSNKQSLLIGTAFIGQNNMPIRNDENNEKKSG